MSELFAERLSKFTPTSGGLDRDSLLFAAGRASARPNRLWQGVASALAATQLVSLALLWPRPVPAGAGPTGPIVIVERTPPPSSDSKNLWTVRHNLLESETEIRPSESGTLIESEPPLRAFGPAPPSLLN